MKKLNTPIICILTLPVLLFSFKPIKGDGDDPSKLLYSEQAMKRLKKEIELKNESFDPNAASKTLFTVPQGVAAYLEVEGINVARIKKLIDGNAGWKTVAALLKEKEKVDTAYFIKSKTARGVSFYPLEMGRDRLSTVETKDPENYTRNLSGKWVYTHFPKTSYSEESICALFIRKELKPQPLPLAAVTCIRYTDHLIDTNTTIFTKVATNNTRLFSYGVNPIIGKLIKLTHNFPGKPEWKNDTSQSSIEQYYKDFNAWEEARTRYVDDTLSKTEEFRTLLNAAYKEVSEKDTVRHSSMNELESYVEKYISPSAALALKRKRIVIGGCSMDNAPIIHAANIARLAGETCCMEIFLRSHLNILNDRFSRVSDGSYAEPGRNTYARELELLGTRLEYLIPGTLIVAKNLSNDHYQGDVQRAGRAMAELESRKKVYEEIERLINTETLDLLNRVRFVFLAQHYNHYLLENQHTQEARQNLKRLSEALKSFPGYIRQPLTTSIASMEKDVKG
ncbi:hypothetical protein BDE36_0425 [Arcticibacter tournemirensis]|uniref:Uncharacterized protein n=1 Tax=Arcticibacter tournemirensis TaxID=699437 RepID=A0A5M9HJD8_9SPHI|nr:hypothetical protein [Arcticibacter tournemirensis]KAA8485551.1 hypothetical protein F1649_03460 [Arcticibacter tournemirensis]TQM48735.1 hypothetical protein BDE36_0425 [Arcticibacter tournemirensis]